MDPSTKALLAKLDKAIRAQEKLRAEVERLAERVRVLEADAAKRPVFFDIDGGRA